MTQKQKRPGEAATSSEPMSNSIPTGEQMNGKTDTTTLMLKKELEHIYGEVSDLLHMLHFLDGNLEESLDFRRGVQNKDAGAVKLMFDRESIDATQWLAGQSWLKARKLRNHLNDVFNSMVDAERRAAV